jgi:hypothetical protein
MNKLSKPLAIGAVALFVLGIFLVAYQFIVLPEALRESSSAVDLNVSREMQPEITKLAIVVGLSLMMGLAAIFFQLMMTRRRVNEVQQVYDPMANQRATTAKLDEEDEDTHDVSALDETVVDDIKKIAATKDSANTKLEKALSRICNHLEASQGAVYACFNTASPNYIELKAGYALMKSESQITRYEYGEGLPGQVAKEGNIVNISKVPDGYIQVLSGLGSATPTNLLICPVEVNKQIKGIVELASFTKFTNRQSQIVKQAFELIGKVFEESIRETPDHTEGTSEEVVADVNR